MKLVPLPEEKMAQFKADMKYAFRKVASEGDEII